jgi:translation initiation factor 2B subunit (eIF-2B alpha/beta/delta family)
LNYADFNKQIHLLIKDNTHGATYIENKLIDILIEAADKLKKPAFMKLVKRARDLPAVMVNVLNIVELTEKKITEPGGAIGEFLKALKIGNMLARELVVKLAAEEIINKSSIVTISYSSLVYHSVSRAIQNGWQGEILVPESRPMCEGKMLAKDLASLSAKAVYGTDCQVFSMLDDVEAAFIGADAVGRDFFINKTGTKALIAALDIKKPIFILADTIKYYTLPDNFRIPEMPAGEIWKNYPENVRVVNKYFEKIDFAPNMVFINENGTLTPDKIKKYIGNNEISG